RGISGCLLSYARPCTPRLFPSTTLFRSGLSGLLLTGMVLVGCAPGGTASNVIVYLSRGDVAVSVTLTSVATMLSPVLTPRSASRSEEHTSELQSRENLVCRLLREKNTRA